MIQSLLIKETAKCLLFNFFLFQNVDEFNPKSVLLKALLRQYWKSILVQSRNTTRSLLFRSMSYLFMGASCICRNAAPLCSETSNCMFLGGIFIKLYPIQGHDLSDWSALSSSRRKYPVTGFFVGDTCSFPIATAR